MIFDDKTFILGVGAPKAGTTWLYNYLYERGDIFMPRRKELHYFDAKYRPDIVRGARRRRLEEWQGFGNATNSGADQDSSNDDHIYKDFFIRRVPKDIEVYGEITPAYSIVGEPVYRKIRDLFPTIRVIFIMRDPVERFYSHVRMFKNKRTAKTNPQRDLEAMIDDPKFVELSSYENTVRSLDAVFGSDEVIYLFYETLFCVPTIRALCSSLGVEYRPANFDLVVNSGGSHNSVHVQAHERLLAKFESTYRFCVGRFGADLPDQWHIAPQKQSGFRSRQNQPDVAGGHQLPDLTSGAVRARPR